MIIVKKESQIFVIPFCFVLFGFMKIAASFIWYLQPPLRFLFVCILDTKS